MGAASREYLGLYNELQVGGSCQSSIQQNGSDLNAELTQWRYH